MDEIVYKSVYYKAKNKYTESEIMYFEDKAAYEGN